jgi:transposase
VFTITGTRGAKVIREMLGENYNRVLTSDRWTAYTWINRRQLCWVHLRHNFQAMIDRENYGSEIGKLLLESSDQLFHWWHRVRDGTLARSSFQKYVGALRRSMRGEVETRSGVLVQEDRGHVPQTTEAGVIDVDLRLDRRDRADQ